MLPCLNGIRVLDFTRALAGPYCTRMLCDLGAEVLKVEPPPDGDATRRITYVRDDGYSGYIMYANRGKLGLAINLQTPAGLDIVRRLAALSDVVVENFRPGVMDRLGLGYADLQRLNPSIILCSISGYGATGPYRELPGQDLGAQALAGVADLTGDPQGTPVVPNFSLTDSHAGIHGAVAILAALVKREETGRGQHIDLAISDGAFWLHDTGVQEALAGRPPRRQGPAHPTLVPRGVFPVKSGWLALDAWRPAHWARLAQALGRPELATDPRFATPVARVQRREEVLGLVGDWLARFPDAAAASAALEKAGVPAEPVATIPQAVAHPQVQARRALARTRDPALGRIPVQRGPFSPVDKEGLAAGTYPLYGGANVRVLTGLLGCSREAVAQMYFDNVIQAEERASAELLALLQEAEAGRGAS